MLGLDHTLIIRRAFRGGHRAEKTDLHSPDCELAAAFVTQWKAYPISTSLICTTG